MKSLTQAEKEKGEKWIIEKLQQSCAHYESQIKELKKQLDDSRSETDVYFEHIKHLNVEVAIYQKRNKELIGMMVSQAEFIKKNKIPTE